jgi:hypothetical protein
MRRALAAALVVLAGVLFGWLAALTPEPVTLASVQVVHAYSYDSHDHGAGSTSTSSKRGPPASSRQATGYTAVGPWSRGTSSRPVAGTTSVTLTYDERMLRVPVAHAVVTARRSASAVDGVLSPLAVSGVAAEAGGIPAGSTADAATSGGRITASVRSRYFQEGVEPPTCSYCQQNPAEHLDHVIPRSRGGDLSPDNLTPACSWCNLSKGARPAPVNPPSGYVGEWPRRSGHRG